ncbi:MAG TPA: thioredoxin domain-containing protein [Flavobacterium sp.]|jgi:rhodanese-related sulfurtransferase
MKAKLLVFLCSLILASCNSQTQPNVETVPPTAFADKLKQTPNAQLIDVRTPEEYADQHLNDSKNINWNGPDFETQAAQLDKSEPVFVYCKIGGRSAQAAAKLHQIGFSKVYNMEGGILKWNSAGLAKADEKQVGMTIEAYNKMISNGKVLVDFSAEWCAPCKKMKPYIVKFKQQMKDRVTIVQLDADANKTLMQQLKIDELPALLLYENNNLKWKHNGFIAEEDLKKQLQ